MALQCVAGPPAALSGMTSQQDIPMGEGTISLMQTSFSNTRKLYLTKQKQRGQVAFDMQLTYLQLTEKFPEMEQLPRFVGDCTQLP